MGVAVQFRGRESVMSAFESKGINRWAFFSGRQLLHKNEIDNDQESSQVLSDWLNLISSSTNAVYTLRFYESLDGGKITDKTPCDASFNFRLDIDEQELNVGQYKGALGNTAVLNELAQMRKEIQELREEAEEEDDDNSNDILGKIMESPIAAGIIGKIFNINIERPAKIGGVPGNDGNEQLTIEQSINILASNDADIAVHLSKLARLSTKKPADFKFLLSVLDNMTV